MKDTVQLTLEQEEAISEISKNLQIIACAGSGKTEVISRRIANILNTDPSVTPANIVAFTFTEKAAESLKVRISRAIGKTESELDGMFIGTIHGFCNNLLRNYSEKFKDFKILDTVKNHLFVRKYNKQCGLSNLGLKPRPNDVNLFLTCIDKLIDDYANKENWDARQLKAFEDYRNYLYDKKFFDFSLMIFEAINQIETNEEVKQYIGSIKYLVVDEYQDVNDLQEKLIKLIVDAGANVCVVGDDDQTIYKFRGSNADNMISFEKRYSDVHQVCLDQNFRCTDKIVDVADCVIQNNENRIFKKMISKNKCADSNVAVVRFDNPREEGRWIADKIAELHVSGIPYKEMAILLRKGKHINTYSSILKEYGIPVSIGSSEQFFKGVYYSKLVQTLQILKDLDKKAFHSIWNDSVDQEHRDKAFKLLRNYSRTKISLSNIIRDFCDSICFLDESYEDIETRRNCLNGLVMILDDFDAIYGADQLSFRLIYLRDFLVEQAAEEYKYHNFENKNENEDAVQLMTVHKSKGLEFHTVFLPKLIKREFPVSPINGKKFWHVLKGTFEENKSKYDTDLEDERKLFYVAVTRAKSNLYLTYDIEDQPISTFLYEADKSKCISVEKEDIEIFLNGKRKKSNENEEVRYARKQLYEFYGAGAHLFPALYEQMKDLKNWSPKKVLEEAQSLNLI